MQQIPSKPIRRFPASVRPRSLPNWLIHRAVRTVMLVFVLVVSAVAIAWLSGRDGASAAAAQAPAPNRRPSAVTPMPLPPDLHIPVYQRGPSPFHDGETLIYEAVWMGIPAAEARITLSQNRQHPGWWIGQMWLDSSRLVDPFYRMRDYFREDFAGGSLQPQSIYILQHEKRRIDQWHTTFAHDTGEVVAIKTNRRGQTVIRRFTGGNPLGPFSGAIMALSQPLTNGDDLTFDVFSGGNRYVFAFKVVGRERIVTALGTFDTLKIEPWVLWLSENSYRSQARQTTLWVTADRRHLPVRIEADVFIGTVRADLTQIVPAAHRPDATATPAAGAAPGD